MWRVGSSHWPIMCAIRDLRAAGRGSLAYVEAVTRDCCTRFTVGIV